MTTAYVLLRMAADAEAAPGSEAALLLDASSLVALGQALDLRKGDTELRLRGIAVGPETWDGGLREALALGLDEVTRVWSPGMIAADALATAAAIAPIVAPGALAVFCGAAATDHGSGVLGAILAELLGWPLLAEVIAAHSDTQRLLATVMVNAGLHRTYQVGAPTVFVAAALPPPPLYPPLARRLAARLAAIAELAPPDAVPKEAATRFEFLGYGPPRPRMRHLITPEASTNPGDRLRQLMSGGAQRQSTGTATGDPAALARQLADLLAAQGLISGGQ
jgi:electron transfer flavoprotein alpha/beta subunit